MTRPTTRREFVQLSMAADQPSTTSLRIKGVSFKLTGTLGSSGSLESGSIAARSGR